MTCNCNSHFSPDCLIALLSLYCVSPLLMFPRMGFGMAKGGMLGGIGWMGLSMSDGIGGGGMNGG